MIRFFMMLAVPALLAACGEHAPAGSPLAARFAGAEFVGKAYDVDPVRVNDDPIISGDTAKVGAEFLHGVCKLDLVRKVDANQYGWLVTKVVCARKA